MQIAVAFLAKLCVRPSVSLMHFSGSRCNVAAELARYKICTLEVRTSNPGLCVFSTTHDSLATAHSATTEKGELDEAEN